MITTANICQYVSLRQCDVSQATDASAKAVYNILLLILPRDANAGSWNVSKRLLKQVCDARVQKVETCPYDHIAFIDLKHPKMQWYKHAHRTCCPVCGKDRYLTLPNGRRKPAKVIYHLPIGPWMKDLFRDEEVAHHLDVDETEKPPGHVTKSKGWHDKVRRWACEGLS